MVKSSLIKKDARVSASIPAEANNNRQFKVLVIDDNRLQRRLLTRGLINWGYSVFEAESGVEALSFCKDTPVDMVLSDWMMLGMDGLGFYREFRRICREGYGYCVPLTSKDG